MDNEAVKLSPFNVFLVKEHCKSIKISILIHTSFIDGFIKLILAIIFF